MTQFNSSISYGRVKFPNSSKWSNKAKNEGYRTIIIGDCEWFAEDLIEVLENPVLLSIGNVNYNLDRTPTKLHEVTGDYTPTTAVSDCTPHAKWLPSDQPPGGDDSIPAETDPTKPYLSANTLPCFVRTPNADVDTGETLIYNYKGARLVAENLPNELKEEGWKLPDKQDILNLLSFVHSVVNPTSTNSITDTATPLSTLTSTEMINIRRALGAELNNTIFGGAANLNDGSYSTDPPLTTNYSSTSNADINRVGFSAVYAGTFGSCAYPVANGSPIPSTYSTANTALKFTYLNRHRPITAFWGGEMGDHLHANSPGNCTYATTDTGYATINGCGATSFDYGSVWAMQLLSWGFPSTGSTTVNRNTTLTVTKYPVNLGAAIRLCRKLPFKVKNNKNFGLETVATGAPDTTANKAYYLISPQTSNSALDCIQNLVFDIKNNYGATRRIATINFRESPLSQTVSDTLYQYVNANFKLEKIDVNGTVLSNITSSVTLSTSSIFGITGEAPPSFRITTPSGSPIELTLGQSVRVTIPVNFGIAEPEIVKNELQWYPIVSLAPEDADEHAAGVGTSTAYKVPKNCPILLNKQEITPQVIRYAGTIDTTFGENIGYTVQPDTGAPVDPDTTRAGSIYLPTIQVSPIEANLFNNWGFPNQQSITSLSSFLSLSNPVDYDFTPGEPFQFDATPNQSGFVEYRIPNPTIQTINWQIVLTGTILANSSDFTFQWINAVTSAVIATGLTCDHAPDTIIKLKITWDPTSAYVYTDTEINIHPLSGNNTVAPETNTTPAAAGVADYGWTIRLSGESEATGPKADILCESFITNPNPLNLLVNVATSFTITIPYANGNGYPYSISGVSSTGVVGLTAAGISGTLATGGGGFTFTVTGTPTSVGNASFSFVILDNPVCVIQIPILAPIPNEWVSQDLCVGDKATLNNYNCNLGSVLSYILIDGITVTDFTVSSEVTPCTIAFTVPDGVSPNDTVTVDFYGAGNALLDSVPLSTKVCGGNFFGPDASEGSAACSTITYTNTDCSVIQNLEELYVDGVLASYAVISNTSPCQILIVIPPLDGIFPKVVKIDFFADGRSYHSESYLITANCDGEVGGGDPINPNCLELLETDNLTFVDCETGQVVPFEEGTIFKRTGWTISFSTELGVWESRHTYLPYMYMYNTKAMYTLYREFGVDSFWKHTERVKRLLYYGRPVQDNFELDIIFPGEDRRTTTGSSTTKNSNKIFSAFAISSDSFEDGLNMMRNKYNLPFTEFYVYNSFQISGLVDMSYLSNVRRVDGSWVINEFRDLSRYGSVSDGLATLSPGVGEQMFLSEGEINFNYISSTKEWYDKRKFVDKWVGLRLIYNPSITNSNVDLVYLYNVVFNSRQSFR
jgi:hypothetical protein